MMGWARPFSDEMTVSQHMYCDPNTTVLRSYTDRDLDFTRSIKTRFPPACTFSLWSMEKYQIGAIRDYSLWFVNIHPFADWNGRTCRLILNAVLAKYAGIIVPLGEKDEEHDVYLEVADRESASQESWDWLPWIWRSEDSQNAVERRQASDSSRILNISALILSVCLSAKLKRISETPVGVVHQSPLVPTPLPAIIV